MRKYFQRKYAMSAKGASDLIHSTIWTVLMDLSFIFPVMLSFLFLESQLQVLLGGTGGTERTPLTYIALSCGAFVLMFVIAYFQYHTTYTKIYEESALRRINLAETLRKLPLAFFGKKDIADLSSTIMEDTTQIEQLFSHAVPQLYASAVTLSLMAVMLFLYNWQLSLAVFWVVPIAGYIFYKTRRLQNTEHQNLYSLKRDIADTMQEGLDSIHDIKSYNRENDFSAKLNAKLSFYEQKLIRSELVIGSAINVSYVVLKLGLPSVILAGAYLLTTGAISIFYLFCFSAVGLAHLQSAHGGHE